MRAAGAPQRAAGQPVALKVRRFNTWIASSRAVLVRASRMELERVESRFHPSQIASAIVSEKVIDHLSYSGPARTSKSAVLFLLESKSMNQTYTQIVKQIESLQRRADAARAKEVAGVVGRIKEAISFYRLSATELGLADGPAAAAQSAKAAPRATTRSAGAAKKKASKSKVDVTAKFRDEAGNEWVGRGPRPLWLREAIASGKSLSDYAVAGGEAAADSTTEPSSPKAAKTRKKRRAKKAAPVAKYKDSASGLTWSGRGRKPGWFSAAIAAGQTPESMAV